MYHLKIAENIERVRARIAEAAARRGADPAGITLVAVSKTAGEEEVAEAIKYGIKDFGENRVQELLKKQNRFPQVRWHMIGHLQTNKVKDVINSACLIHSLDRWTLAEYIERKANNTDLKIKALVQVNISGESSKGGFKPDEVKPFMASMDQFEHLQILGLMTMAPEETDPEKTRPVFKELRRLFDDIKKEHYPNVNMSYLSMGMTGDFEVAVEEGANIVRVGRAIFAQKG